MYVFKDGKSRESYLHGSFVRLKVLIKNFALENETILGFRHHLFEFCMFFLCIENQPFGGVIEMHNF